MKKNKLGIVLSGGGAKGAYEVGFLKYLAEVGIQADAIAGTSIGALNGAIYASKRDTKKSAQLLTNLWEELASDKVLKVDMEKAVKNIVEVYLFFSPIPVTKLTKIVQLALKAGKSEEGLLTQLPIENRLKKYAPESKLLSGLPFYIGVTESQGNAKDTLNLFGLGSSEALFKKVQNFSKDNMHKAIMASAALPILFDAIEVEGIKLRDGCLGSTGNEWGNTPAKPLIEEEGCTHLIVCHLDEGNFFDRHDPLFDNIPIIEVVPEKGTFTSDFDPLKFKAEKINQWIEQGYNDSKRIILVALEAIKSAEESKIAEARALSGVEKLKNRKFSL